MGYLRHGVSRPGAKFGVWWLVRWRTKEMFEMDETSWGYFGEEWF